MGVTPGQPTERGSARVLRADTSSDSVGELSDILWRIKSMTSDNFGGGVRFPFKSALNSSAEMG